MSPKGCEEASHTEVAAMAGGNSGFPSPDSAVPLGTGGGDRTLVVRTLQEEAAITERARLKKERQALRRQRHQEECNTLVASIKLEAAKITSLRKYMFKTDDELAHLTPQDIAIVRQFEQPKKSTAFGVESASKLIETETRGQAEKVKFKINVENATIHLPEKADETTAPVYVDIAIEEK